MRLAVITDIHLAPAGHPPVAWHHPLARNAALERFCLALELCVQAEVEGIAILGDVTHLGDVALLNAGVKSAAATRLPTWMVPGNHDVLVEEGALSRAVAVAGGPYMHFADPSGEAVGNVRIAGIGLARDSARGRLCGTCPDVDSWGDDVVILLSHFPLLSRQEQTDAAGLKYAGAMEDIGVTVAPLLKRAAPTVVLHGHLHIGCTEARGDVVQIACAALAEPPFPVYVLQIGCSGENLVVEL